MADDTSTTDTSAEATATAEQAVLPENDLGEAGKKALAAERAAKKAAEKQLSELQKRLQEFEDRDKTEAQKLAERAAAAEQERDALRLTAMRQRIALEKGLPPQLADRLKGSTEEEMSSDADALLELVPVAGDATPGPRPDLSQGARSAMALNGDPLLQSVKNVLGIR
jgi:hypothetical protein